MTYINWIKNYIPYNEQEQKDKEMMLHYINNFDKILNRENETAHFTTSAFVLNKARDKVLMIYHNIYNSWAWTGGHADGEIDLLSVAIREVQEETWVNNVSPIVSEIFSLEIIPVSWHVRKGKYVAWHLHLNATYLLEADESEKLVIQEDENSNVKWVPIDQVIEHSTEDQMKVIYSKVISKINNLPKNRNNFIIHVLDKISWFSGYSYIHAIVETQLLFTIWILLSSFNIFDISKLLNLIILFQNLLQLDILILSVASCWFVV